MNISTLRNRSASLALRVVPAAMGVLFTASTVLAQEGEAAPAAPKSSSVFDVFKDAGAIGMLIVVLSIVALAVIIENFVSLKRDKLAPAELIDEVQALFDEEQYQEAMELCENEPTFFTRVAGAGIAKIGHSFEVIEQAISEMGDEESIRLHQKIGWLSLIANVAPMMGLLGTVGGMIKAFNTIADSGGQANPAELAERYLEGAPHDHVRSGRRHPDHGVLRLPAQPPGQVGHRGRRDRRGPLRALPPGAHGSLIHPARRLAVSRPTFGPSERYPLAAPR